MDSPANVFFTLEYSKKPQPTPTKYIPGNGVYVFFIAGKIEVDNQILNTRDAMDIIDFDRFEIKINSKAKILLVEVPMK